MRASSLRARGHCRWPQEEPLDRVQQGRVREGETPLRVAGDAVKEGQVLQEGLQDVEADRAEIFLASGTSWWSLQLPV